MRISTFCTGAAILALSSAIEVAHGQIQLRFGSILPLGFEGLKDLSKSVKQALDVGVSDLNSQIFNPLGANVSIVYADSFFDKGNATSAAKQFGDAGLLGVIGEVGSGVTEPVALELTKKQVMQCSGSATSENLSKKEYRYFFRTIPPDSVQGFVLGQIVNTFKWKKLGLIHQDTAYGKGIISNLLSHAAASGITVLTTQEYSDARDYERVLHNLKTSDARIIVWAGVYTELLELFPIARRMGMFSPEYVWIATENAISSIDVIRAGIATGKYHQQDLDTLNGLLISTPVEGQEEAGKFKAFNTTYFTRYNEAIGQYSLFFVDCLSLMLNSLRKYQSTSNVPWADIAQGKFPRDLSALLGPIDGLEGITGSIHLDTNFDRIGNYKVLNFYNGQLRPIGVTTDATYNVQLNDSMKAIFGSGTTKVPSAEPILKSDWFEYKSPVSAVLMILYIAMMVLNFGSLVVVFLWRKRKEIKALSPQFMIIMGLGMQLAFAAIFTLIGEQTKEKCMARPWMYGISFAVVMGCLIGKTFRIWKVFANERLAAPIGFLQILRLAGAFSVGEFIILLTWSLYSPLSPFPVINKEKGTYQYICMSPKANDAFTGVIFGYNGLLLLAATYLAVVTRNVPSKYSESKFIALTVYSLLIWCTLIIAVSYTSGSASSLVFFITTFGVLFVTATTWALLIGRVLISQVKKNEVEFASLPNSPKGMRPGAAGNGSTMPFKSSSQLPSSTGSTSGKSAPASAPVQVVRGDIAEFPIKVTSSWIARWERYEVILTTVPVARLALRPLTPGTDASRSYFIEISKVRASKAALKDAKHCFELDFPGLTLVVQATTDEQVDEWLRKMKQAGSMRGEDSTGQSSASQGQNTGPTALAVSSNAVVGRKSDV